MRISDWSSDVCSSDLPSPQQKLGSMLLSAMDSSLRWNDENQLVQSVHCELCVLCGPFVFPNIPYSSRSREARNQGALAESTSNTYICTHGRRSEEHTSELQSLMRISYAVFCLKKKNN